MQLAVELYDTVIGQLEGEDQTFDFFPTTEGLDRFGLASRALSVAIPLTRTLPRHHRGRRRNWFAELLPEGDQYDYMLAQGGLARGDTLSFLARYGRDVAGALQLWDIDDPSEPRDPALRAVTDAEVRQLLEDPIGSPLANASRQGKSSLAGVQPKVVLARTPDGWAQVLGGYPSTHILKPQLVGRNRTVIYDEEYGSRIARSLGLAAFDTTITEFDGLPTLVIERYDRVDGHRVHQEDLSQALGASRSQKYQQFGGVVNLKRIAANVREFVSDQDVRLLARMVILAVALGNLDMHAKNLGLLHAADGSVVLAPAYDVVPHAHVAGNDGMLALSVNGKYRHAEVTRDDLNAEFVTWGGVRGIPLLVDSTLDEIGIALRTEMPLDGAYGLLQDQLIGFLDNLISGNPVAGTI